jgi:hypothetical protein
MSNRPVVVLLDAAAANALLNLAFPTTNAFLAIQLLPYKMNRISFVRISWLCLFVVEGLNAYPLALTETHRMHRFAYYGNVIQTGFHDRQ